jgi:hypothetical protein
MGTDVAASLAVADPAHLPRSKVGGNAVALRGTDIHAPGMLGRADVDGNDDRDDTAQLVGCGSNHESIDLLVPSVTIVQ